MTKKELQEIISAADDSGLAWHAFGKAPAGWQPTPDCLKCYYSSGEKVLCSILLCFYFDMYGRPDFVEVPDKAWDNCVTDLIWPGAWYFKEAASRLLTNEVAWAALQMLLPVNAHLPSSS